MGSKQRQPERPGKTACALRCRCLIAPTQNTQGGRTGAPHLPSPHMAACVWICTSQGHVQTHKPQTSPPTHTPRPAADLVVAAGEQVVGIAAQLPHDARKGQHCTGAGAAALCARQLLARRHTLAPKAGRLQARVVYAAWHNAKPARGGLLLLVAPCGMALPHTAHGQGRSSQGGGKRQWLTRPTTRMWPALPL